MTELAFRCVCDLIFPWMYCQSKCRVISISVILSDGPNNQQTVLWVDSFVSILFSCLTVVCVTGKL